MKETFVIATNNKGKLLELARILEDLGACAESLREAGIYADPEETGATFEENALIKARAACKASGLPAIADDSGIEVDALGGAPGVYSNRWCGGENHADFLLAKMEGETNRKAHFTSAAACVFPDGEEIVVRGECRGVITHEKRGDGGFGYDPVFLYEEFSKTFAELSVEEKNKISHRGEALRKLSQRLKERKNADE